MALKPLQAKVKGHKNSCSSNALIARLTAERRNIYCNSFPLRANRRKAALSRQSIGTSEMKELSCRHKYNSSKWPTRHLPRYLHKMTLSWSEIISRGMNFWRSNSIKSAVWKILSPQRLPPLSSPISLSMWMRLRKRPIKSIINCRTCPYPWVKWTAVRTSWTSTMRIGAENKRSSSQQNNLPPQTLHKSI